jgi:modulator of FtsH protease
MERTFLKAQQASAEHSLEVSKVLRNTYALLSMTILFSAFTAFVAMSLNVPYMGLWMLLPYIALLFAVEKTKNSALGLVFVFALTGWLGFTLGPILNYYLGVSGVEPILTALGGTALLFFSLSAFVLITKKDMSFMTQFMMTGFVVAFVAMIAAYFLNMPGLSLVVSCLFLALSSMLIMWQTSSIIHGGERNYISATVSLYVALYNIFTILLSFLGGSDD